jgi:hypothetical protein
LKDAFNGSIDDLYSLLNDWNDFGEQKFSEFV